MTKNELRAGYIVVLRNGNRYMVMPMVTDEGEKLVFSNLGDSDSYKSFSKYDEDLNNYKNKQYDIVTVYGLSSRISGLSVDLSDREILWERVEQDKDDSDDTESVSGNCVVCCTEAESAPALSHKVNSMDDLKVGYMIVLRNGRVYVVMPSNDGLVLAHKDGHYIKNFDKYNDDMTNKKNSEYDITEVYGYPAGDISPFNLNIDNREKLR